MNILSPLIALRIGANKLLKNLGLTGLNWLGGTMTSIDSAAWYINGVLKQATSTSFTIPIDFTSIGQTLTQSTFSKSITNSVLITDTNSYDFTYSVIQPDYSINTLKVDLETPAIYDAVNISVSWSLGYGGLLVNDFIMNGVTESINGSTIYFQEGSLTNSFTATFTTMSTGSAINIDNCQVKSISLPNLTTVLPNTDAYNPTSITAVNNGYLTDFLLPSLELLDGSIFLVGNGSLASVSLPSLRVLSCGSFDSGVIYINNCPSLTSITLPNLEYIGGGYSSYGTCYLNFHANNLQTISLPSLISISLADVTLSSNDNLTSVSFPQLTSLGQSYFIFPYLSSLNSIDFNNLISMFSSTIDLQGCFFGAEASFNSLQAMEYSMITFENSTIDSLNLPALTSIGEGSYLGMLGTNLSSLSLPSLTTLQGTLDLDSCNFTSTDLDNLFIELGNTVSSYGLGVILAANQQTGQTVTSASASARAFLTSHGITITL